MTTYEHVMLGVDGTLAAGLHRRYGWQIVAWAGCAAALPDWDGLTLLLGADYHHCRGDARHGPLAVRDARDCRGDAGAGGGLYRGFPDGEVIRLAACRGAR